MQLIDALRQAQGGAAVETVAKAFNLQPAQAEAALEALINQFGRVFERNTLSRGGLADVMKAAGDPRYQATLSDPAALKDPATREAGIALLEQMLGNKDQSRALAARAAQASGLTETLIKQLLPYVLPMIIGAIAKSGGRALQDILARIPGLPGSAGGQAGGGSGGGFDIPLPQSRTQPAPYQPTPRRGQGPLPLPGDHTPLGGGNPYSDLSDEMRNGRLGRSATGGLPGMIRSILGSLFGFQNRGVISWLIRLVVLRWGWSLLKLFFGRLLTRR